LPTACAVRGNPANGEGSARMSQPAFDSELRRLRGQRGLSLKKFAKVVNYDPGYLCKVENGLKPPTEALAKVCDAALETGGQLARLAAEHAETRERRLKGPPESTTALRQGGMLPVVVDGRLVFVPFDFSAQGVRGLGEVLNNKLQQHGAPALNDARPSTDTN
jgi:hypothetical protein